MEQGFLPPNRSDSGPLIAADAISTAAGCVQTNPAGITVSSVGQRAHRKK